MWSGKECRGVSVSRQARDGPALHAGELILGMATLSVLAISLERVCVHLWMQVVGG